MDPEPQTTYSPVPGRRAQRTQDALEAAAKKVIKTLTDERMAQCFPTYAELYPDLIRSLKSLIEDKYNEGITKGWQEVVEKWNFIEKANELDQLLSDADARRKKGEAPANLYMKGMDAYVTIPNATVPILKEATAEIRAKRLALATKNQETFESIVVQNSKVERTEKQIKEILSDFEQTLSILENNDEIDYKAIDELQTKLVEAIPEDKL